jgi:hypothetical protein
VGYATAVSAVVAAFTLAPATSAAAKTAATKTGTTTFSNGNATAIAQAFQIAPRTGGLSAAVTIGTVIADYRSTLAQASSQAISLGIVGTTLTTACGANKPTLSPSQLPQPLIAESTKGSAQSTKTTAGDGSLLSGGKETVAVTKLPKSTAGFTGTGVSIPGVLSLSGMTSSSTSQVIAGKARIATATSQVGQLSLAGGLIALDDMTWSVTQRTGTHPQKKTSFSIGGAKIAGLSRPVDTASATTLFDSINKLLAATGLHITAPVQKTVGGVLQITPLVVGIDDSQLGAAVVNPVANAIGSINNSVQAALEKINCTIGSAFSVLDLVEAGVDGSGGLDVDLGGASATSQATNYSDPFGTKTLGGNSSKSSGGSSTGTSGGGGTGSSLGVNPGGDGTGPTPPDPASSTAPTSGGGAAPTLAGTKIVNQSCSTISPAKRPACTSGQGFLVGMIALGALGAIGGTDFAITRRRRRLPRQALTL